MSYPAQNARNKAFMARGFPPGPSKEVAKKLNIRDIYVIQDLHEQYGDIFMLPLSDNPLIVIQHPDHIKQVLGGNGQIDYPRPPNVIKNIERLFGRAQIALDGDKHWGNKQVLMSWIFNRDDNEKMMKPLWSVVSDFLDALKQGVGADASVEVSKLAKLIGNDLNALISMGRSYNGTRLGVCPQSDALERCDRIFLTRAMDKNWKKNEPAAKTKEFDDSRKLILDTFIDGLDRIRTGKNAPDGSPLQHNIMTHLAKAHGADSERPSEFEMLTNMVGFLAGVGNTSRLYTTAIENLSRRPECQHKILEELHHVSGLSEHDAQIAAHLGLHIDDSPETWTYEKLSQLEYTKCFMMECLRLYTPSVSVAPRQSTLNEGSKFAAKTGDYSIPPGHTIMCNFFGAHRHHDHWERAETFDAMRWNEAPKGKPVSCKWFAPQGFFPFGFGAHSCVGRQLAQLGCLIIIARLVGRYVVVPKKNTSPAVFNTTNSAQIFGFTEAVDGVEINLVERQKNTQFPKAASAAARDARRWGEGVAESVALKKKPVPGDRVIDRAEVRKHNTRDSLWVVLAGKVLDMTQFIYSHPGGEELILRQGGKDVTYQFFKLVNHSEGAKRYADECVIGRIGTGAKL